MKAVILSLAIVALVAAQTPPTFTTKLISGGASYDNAISSSKGITYFSYASYVQAVEMVDGAPKTTKFTIPANQRLYFINEAKNHAYFYDSSAKTLLRYSLDKFVQDTEYRRSLGSRTAKFAMVDLDTLVTIEKNSDYDYIYIQSLSNDKTEPFQIMRTQLGGMIYHPTSKRIFYQSNASDSKGVYELNFSSVSTTSAWSPNKFQNMGYRKVEIDSIINNAKYTAVTKNLMIIASGTQPVVARVYDLKSTTFKYVNVTLASQYEPSMQIATVDYDQDIWGNKFSGIFQVRKDNEPVVSFNNYNNAVYNVKDKWIAFSNGGFYYSFVNFCQDGKYYHNWTCVEKCPTGYSGNFFKKECLKNTYLLQQDGGILSALLGNKFEREAGEQ